MVWQDAALAMAGVIGSGVAVVHGILTQRLMVRPVEALFVADGRTARPVRRLVPLLLQFSTFNWLLGGFAVDRRRPVVRARRQARDRPARRQFVPVWRCSATFGERAVVIPAGC